MMIPATHKLFWSDAYRRRFRARVQARHAGDPPALVLNRTLFYPTGGGQPHDMGRLHDCQVHAVEQRDGVIWHWLDHLPAPADEIEGEIDWPRRWDHMQQHSGQHLLSAAFVAQLDRPTLSFHLSRDSVTIDLPGPPPAPGEIDQVWDYALALIAEDRPIHAYAVTPAEAAALPLRKAPTVAGPVRVVEIAGIDWSACGGTHVHSTAAIGGLAITRVERRGDSTRVHFACGGRFATDYRQRLHITQTLADEFTTSVSELPQAVAQLRAEVRQNQKALRTAENRLAAAEVGQWLASAPVQEMRVLRQVLPGADADVLRRYLAALALQPRWVAALGWAGQRPRWVVSRAADLTLDLRTLLPGLRGLPGVQGGGSAELIQGGAADLAALTAVLDLAALQVSAPA